MCGISKWAAITAPWVPLPAPGGAIINTRIRASSRRPVSRNDPVSSSSPDTGHHLVCRTVQTVEVANHLDPVTQHPVARQVTAPEPPGVPRLRREPDEAT